MKAPFFSSELTASVATLDPEASSLLVLAAHYDSKYFTGKVPSAIPFDQSNWL